MGRLRGLVCSMSEMVLLFVTLSCLLQIIECGEFTLYEGNDASQNQVCTLYWDQDTTFNFQHYDACENDETRSGVLRFADYGTIINCMTVRVETRVMTILRSR